MNDFLVQSYRNLPDFKAKHLTLGTFEHAAGLMRIVTAALRSLPAAKLYYALQVQTTNILLIMS